MKSRDYTFTPRRRFKVGDKVEVVGNIPYELLDKTRPLVGRVSLVNGLYILVKPHYKRRVAWFYPSELKHIDNNAKSDVKV
jgi:hypothetical protein